MKIVARVATGEFSSPLFMVSALSRRVDAQYR